MGMLCVGLRAGQGGDCRWGEGRLRTHPRRDHTSAPGPWRGRVPPRPRWPQHRDPAGGRTATRARRRPAGPCSETSWESLPWRMRAGCASRGCEVVLLAPGVHFPRLGYATHVPSQSGCVSPWGCVPEAGWVSLCVFLCFWVSSVCVSVRSPLRDCISGLSSRLGPRVFAVGVGVCARPLRVPVSDYLCPSFCQHFHVFSVCVCISSLCARLCVYQCVGMRACFLSVPLFSSHLCL